MNFSFDYLV